MSRRSGWPCFTGNRMPSENPFRIALVVVMLMTISVTAYHRWQAAKSGEKISHKEEGYVFAIVLRLVGLFLWISTFGYLLFPASFQWASMPLPTWKRLNRQHLTLDYLSRK